MTIPRPEPQLSTPPHHRVLVALLLVALLAAALWLRLPTINESVPFLYREDEAHHFNRLVTMVKSGDYNPHYFLKPSLHFYLRTPAVWASVWWAQNQGELKSLDQIITTDSFGVGDYAFSVSHPTILKANRAMSVLLSIGAVLLTFLIGRLVMRSNFWALFAAALITFSPALLVTSGIIGVDVVMTFMCLLAVYACLRTLEYHSKGAVALWPLVVAGVLCGLAVSSKYNAAPIAILPLLVTYLAGVKNKRALLFAVTTPLLGFFIGSPFILVSIPLFIEHVSYEVWHYAIAGDVNSQAKPGLAQILHYGNWLISEGIGLETTLIGSMGFIGILISRSKRGLVFSTFPLLFFLLMICQKTNYTRNMLVFIPFLAIAGAAMLQVVALRPLWGARLAAPLVAFLVLLSVGNAGLAERATLKFSDDSRRQADSLLSKMYYGETAIDGRLQFPIKTYRRAGVTKVGSDNLLAEKLFLAGFNRVALGFVSLEDLSLHNNGAPPKNTFGYLEREAYFPGAPEVQRIINNPTIAILSFADDFLEFRSRPELIDPSLLHELQFRPEGALPRELDSSPRTLRCSASPGEDYCWTSQVVTPLLLDFNKTASRISVTAEVMTPWPDQVVTFGTENEPCVEDCSFKFQQPGKWQKVSFEMPAEFLKENRLWMQVKIIRSPATAQIRTGRTEADTRRLGVAIRSIEVAEVAEVA